MGLLEVEPELGDHLTADERQLVSRVGVPVLTLSAQTLNVDGLLDRTGSFAAFILDGILLNRLAVGEQPALRLLGAGDMVVRSGAVRTALLSESSYRTTGRLRLATLDDRVLLAARRFPRVFAGLQIRLAEQHQRLAAQLVICQLPRVEDRLLALMWLLAETWGRVTTSGTMLPLALTHDALGELVGARRPTVTLALKELAGRGSLLRQGEEWLLVEPPPGGAPPPPIKGEPQLLSTARSGWLVPDPPPPQRTFDELTSIVAALRDNHARSAGETRQHLERARRTRERTQSLREQIARQQVSRRERDSDRPPAP